jgi:DNA-binding NarL/FixJ family response regulator
MNVIRVGLIDDHRMFREALQLELARVPDIVLVGGAANAREGLAMVEALCPDVILLDVGLPDISGVELAGQLRTLAPKTKIVALSGYADVSFVEAMLQAGAGGYIVKSAGVDDLLAAIRAVMAGAMHFSADALQALNSSPGKASSMLTARESTILRCIASGMRTAEVASALGIACATVETHRKNIKAKLGIRSIAELTRYALREGLIKG